MTTNGERLWAFRYSSEGKSRSLYFSTAYETLKSSIPTTRASTTSTRRRGSSSPSRSAICAGVWNQVPEAIWGVVQPGQDEMNTFRPVAPVVA